MDSDLVTNLDLGVTLKKLAQGKVRDLYEIDDSTLLFVASDRISAYDVVMKNGIPQKGILLTLLSAHWFSVLSQALPGLRTHFITLDLPTQLSQESCLKLRNRSMQVRRLEVFPIEAIVRGYITGSAWKEYKSTGMVHGMMMPKGLRESEMFPAGPIYTPSTKAEAGEHDENIDPDQAAELISRKYGNGQRYAKRVEELSLALYRAAHDYANKRGIIIADTKFEFGLDIATDEVVLVDEVLTPDSSRFWPKASYEVGKAQASFDKQYLRDWLEKEGLKGREDVEMPEDVVKRTVMKYKEAFEKLVGEEFRGLES